MTTAADGYPLVDLMWTFVVFFALLVYFWLVVTVFGDLFRRHDVSGRGKTGWVVFVLVLPLAGSITYLVTQGRAMEDRDVQQARQVRQRTDAPGPSLAAVSRGVDEIARAKQLLDEGALSQEEFEQLKRRVLV